MGQGAGAALPRQRLASLSFKAFSTLVKAPRITPSQRQKKLLLAEQGGKCAACAQQIGAGCAEFDHIVPVRQAFAGQQQPLSLEGVFQMAYILPERLLALVRPAFDLVLRRIRSLKRCVEA